MARAVRIWYDPEGDFLEVLFSDWPGYSREIDKELVMGRVDEQGSLVEFRVQRVSKMTWQDPLVAHLLASAG
jgi:hypothetical protein